MKLSTLILGSSALFGVTTAPPPPHSHPSSIPTIWLCGDSTAAPGGGHNGTEGWGQFLQYSFDATIARVNNSAYAGRSARSFTREGRFQRIADVAQRGDWVIIEFGHNDGGNPYTDLKGRADCPGTGSETCPTIYNGTEEIVQTYSTYLINASNMFLAKGVKVIISSPTPTNPWEFGGYSYTPSQFVSYASLTATKLGGPSAGVYLVQHGEYSAQAMKNLGKTAVDANYPMDHTHTAPYLAEVLAKAFVLGVKCGTSPLQGHVKNATARLEGPILGSCLSAGETTPI